MSDEALSWPEDALSAPDRLRNPTGLDQALSLACVACMWLLPVIGPLLLRLLLGGRPFALYWFRLSVIVQIVYVLLALSGVAVATTDLVRALGWISIVAWVWALYASLLPLVWVLRRRTRTIFPIPSSWLPDA